MRDVFYFLWDLPWPAFLAIVFGWWILVGLAVALIEHR